MSDTTEAKDKLVTDFNAVMADIDALMTATTNKADTEVKALRARIEGRLSTAKDKLIDAQRGAREKLLDVQHEAVQRAKDAAAATDDYVHDKPWQAIGAAAALGLAIGVLIGRR